MVMTLYMRACVCFLLACIAIAISDQQAELWLLWCDYDYESQNYEQLTEQTEIGTDSSRSDDSGVQLFMWRFAIWENLNAILYREQQAEHLLKLRGVRVLTGSLMIFANLLGRHSWTSVNLLDTELSPYTFLATKRMIEIWCKSRHCDSGDVHSTGMFSWEYLHVCFDRFASSISIVQSWAECVKVTYAMCMHAAKRCIRLDIATRAVVQ